MHYTLHFLYILIYAHKPKNHIPTFSFLFLLFFLKFYIFILFWLFVCPRVIYICQGKDNCIFVIKLLKKKTDDIVKEIYLSIYMYIYIVCICVSMHFSPIWFICKCRTRSNGMHSHPNIWLNVSETETKIIARRVPINLFFNVLLRCCFFKFYIYIYTHLTH